MDEIERRKAVEALNKRLDEPLPEPSSFLARHRTICAVLVELKEHLKKTAEIERLGDDVVAHKLIDEAIDYAQRMSARLMEYKRAEESRTYPGGRTKEEWDVIAAANKIATAEYEDD